MQEELKINDIKVEDLIAKGDFKLLARSLMRWAVPEVEWCVTS